MTELPDLFKQFLTRGIVCLFDDSDLQESQVRATLVANARGITPEIVNELVTNNGGYVFVALTNLRAEQFDLRKMASVSRYGINENIGDDASQLSLYNSIEARHGVGSGISAADRATTINVLAENEPSPKKIVSPGHIFPIEVKGGVLIRNSLSEGAFEFVRAATNSEVAVYVDLLNSQGELYDMKSLQQLCKDKNFGMLALSQLVHHQLRTQKIVTRVAEAKLPSNIGGDLMAYVYRSSIDDGEHLAVTRGQFKPGQVVLTRVQTEFTVADVFGGDNPPSRALLRDSLAAIGKEESGVCIYLRHISPGQLAKQVQSPQATFTTDRASILRQYGMGAQILLDLGIRKIEVLTNNLKRFVGLEQFGIEIVGSRRINNL